MENYFIFATVNRFFNKNVIITGTPEVGGLTVIQGLEIVRGCRGMNIVGGDLVEVILPVWLVYGVLCHGKRSTRRKPPTCRKSLTNFIT